ncbi:caskin-2 [Eurytemora carolleeae]|uniref:caskin-2 n=1 Tax=Eurytemora carolleeae TaxID=1294199 RepID=UPI000C761F16|nr:caskin-2 [Eurytemora carolleeae]|eukprot:XP_023341224.1 caskin-2-like [Eurytemora affinis]
MEPRPPLHLGHAHRLSNVSSQSGGDSISSSRQSHHSSNSSLGDRFEDSICTLNIQDMLNAGIPDEEILTAWLTDLHFEEYYQLFTSAGYDMPTISRMTPEDLTAVGIKKPNHRKKLKAEIGRLNISDGLPDFLPDCLEDWLGLLRLDEYGPNLRSQGYNTILDVTTISIEDLEDTGFYRLGHQKRLLLAIRRAKELLGGKRVQPTTFQTQDTGISKLPPRPSLSSFTHQVHDIQPFHHNQQHSPHLHQQHSFQQQQQPFHSFQQFNPSQSQHNPSQSQHNPSQSQHNQSQCLFQPTSGHQQHTPLQYLPDFMRIKQSGGFASNEELPTSIPDPMPPLQYPLYQTTFQGGTIPHQGGANFQGGYPGSPRFIPRAAGGLGHPPSPSPWRMMRSYDDADILRHADHSVLIHDAPRSQNKSGTLPRPKGTIKPRPVAKIIAKTRESEPEIEVSKEDHGKDLKAGGCDTEDSPGTSSGMSSPNRLQGSPTPTLRRPRRGSDTGIQMRKIGSFESDPGTIPFANDNAGTIRIR